MSFKKIKEYYIFFVIYSVLGWLYEVFLEVVVYRWGFSNRGFLFGPYCPVYGFGAIVFILLFQRLKNKKIKIGNINISPVLIFIGIMVTATAIELGASYILEIATGSWLWEYNSYSFNFQGRIALNPSVRFGIGGMIILYIIQPFFVRITDSFSMKKIDIVFYLLLILMGFDFITRVFLMYHIVN